MMLVSTVVLAILWVEYVYLCLFMMLVDCLDSCCCWFIWHELLMAWKGNLIDEWWCYLVTGLLWWTSDFYVLFSMINCVENSGTCLSPPLLLVYYSVGSPNITLSTLFKLKSIWWRDSIELQIEQVICSNYHNNGMVVEVNLFNLLYSRFKYSSDGLFFIPHNAFIPFIPFKMWLQKAYYTTTNISLT